MLCCYGIDVVPSRIVSCPCVCCGVCGAVLWRVCAWRGALSPLLGHVEGPGRAPRVKVGNVSLMRLNPNVRRSGRLPIEAK